MCGIIHEVLIWGVKMNYDIDLFNKRLEFVYKNYYLMGRPNPVSGSKDVFPKELGGTLISTWLHGNKRRIHDLSLKNVIEKKVIAKNVMDNSVRNIMFLARINYIYKNYVLMGKLNPIQKDNDRFPEELDGALIGPWLQAQKYNIKMMKDNHMAQAIIMNSEINYLAELVKYIIVYKKIPPRGTLFSNNTLMVSFLEDNKKLIYENREEDNYLGLLAKLLEQLDENYFNDLEDKKFLRK